MPKGYRNKATPIIFCMTLLVLGANQAVSGNLPEISGRLSITGYYGFDTESKIFSEARYIPEIAQGFDLPHNQFLDYEMSVNIYGATAVELSDYSHTKGEIKPYRIWGRYSGEQYELRIGLQKINFGSASILRPLMWFDQIDFRDSLQLTDGVYGALGRYFFLNNANVWIWVLWGNDEKKGWDLARGIKNHPEYGGRIQYPFLNGELALSFHHRTANHGQIMDQVYDETLETRVGLDGKWDVTVGLWFETTWIHQWKDLGVYTNTAMYTIGTDYTVGIGNGLTLMAEHLVTTCDENGPGFSKTSYLSAASLSYPVSLFDHIQTVLSFDWNNKQVSFYLNYEHRFDTFTGYFMAFYNPDQNTGFSTDERLTDLSGPGIGIMIVYNY